MSEMGQDVRLINLEITDTDDIWRVFSSYYVESELDGGGDIVFEKSERIYAKVDRHFKMLRFFCYVEVNTLESPDFLKILENVNAASSSVKYSLINESVMCEYGIPLSGHIDHKHLLRVLDHFDEEVKILKIVLEGFLEE